MKWFRKQIQLFLIISLMVVSASCSRATLSTPTGTAVAHQPTNTPIPVTTIAPTATYTSVPTDTPVPIDTLTPTNPATAITTPTLMPTEAPMPTLASTSVPEPMFHVTRSSVNVRRGPGTNYDVVGILQEGEFVSVFAANHDGSWYTVQLADGIIGWISASVGELVDLREPAPIAETVPPPPPPPTIMPSLECSIVSLTAVNDGLGHTFEYRGEGLIPNETVSFILAGYVTVSSDDSGPDKRRFSQTSGGNTANAQGEVAGRITWGGGGNPLNVTLIMIQGNPPTPHCKVGQALR